MASNAAHILGSILDSIKPDECTCVYVFDPGTTNLKYAINQVTDETIEKLQALLPENLVLSAFDLVDREKGSCSPRVRRTSDTNVQYSYSICHSLGKQILSSPRLNCDVFRLH